jgi:hypothetical protein
MGGYQIVTSQIYFFWPALPARFVLNKDPKVWLDGARPPPVSFIEPALAWKWVAKS